MLSVIIAVLILINSNLIPLYCRLTITGIKMEDVYCLHVIGIGIPWLDKVYMDVVPRSRGDCSPVI